MLANPSPDDWLSWRRTHDGLGFSPLDDIDKSNVATLQLAWSLALPPGRTRRRRSCTTASSTCTRSAITCRRSTPRRATSSGITRASCRTFRPTVKRNLALYGDKIYFGTSDVHVVALDVRTGAVVWDRPITDG